MNLLAGELEHLKEGILEMMHLSTEQLMKSEEAVKTLDSELAEVVIHRENRLNALELSIDRDCENIFALFNPVASDLRFVLAMLKINSELERIGDHAVGLCKYVLDNEKPFKGELVNAVLLDDMFKIAISMTNDVREGFENSNTRLVRKVFKKDNSLNTILRNSSDIIADHVKKDPTMARQSLFIFSALRKLERVGDLTKNVAEQIIFYLEAEVVRHKSGKK